MISSVKIAGEKRILWRLFIIIALCFSFIQLKSVVAEASVGTSIPDLSEWQGKLTATEVQNLKKTVPFIILRVQYGSDYKDVDFANNAALCEKYGLKYGVYSFSQYLSTADAKTEAKDLYSRAPDAAFYVNDYEDQTVTSGTTNSATSAWYTALRAKVPHKRILFYSYASFTNSYAATAMKKYDGYWLAAYTSSQPTVAHDLWQYTDDWYASALSQDVDASVKHSQNTSWFLSSRAISYNKIVTTAKKGYTIWKSLAFTSKNGTTVVGKNYTAKYYYDHYNGSTYYSLYGKNGKWVGYANKSAMSVMSATSYGHQATIEKSGYSLWNNFLWAKAKYSSTALIGKTYTIKYKYTCGNGRVYYSLYDGNTWMGYINANAVSVS